MPHQWRRCAKARVPPLVGALTLIGALSHALAQPPTPSPAEMAERVMQTIMSSGDGLSVETAYVVEGTLWEYRVLKRLRLRFERQTSSVADDIPVDHIGAFVISDEPIGVAGTRAVRDHPTSEAVPSTCSMRTSRPAM